MTEYTAPDTQYFERKIEFDEAVGNDFFKEANSITNQGQKFLVGLSHGLSPSGPYKFILDHISELSHPELIYFIFVNTPLKRQRDLEDVIDANTFIQKLLKEKIISSKQVLLRDFDRENLEAYLQKFNARVASLLKSESKDGLDYIFLASTSAGQVAGIKRNSPVFSSEEISLIVKDRLEEEVTLTPNFISKSKKIAFLATKANKRRALAWLFYKETKADESPAFLRHIENVNDRMTVYIDNKALTWPQVEIERDSDYGKSTIKIDVVKPYKEESKKKQPVILMIHGFLGLNSFDGLLTAIPSTKYLVAAMHYGSVPEELPPLKYSKHIVENIDHVITFFGSRGHSVYLFDHSIANIYFLMIDRSFEKLPGVKKYLKGRVGANPFFGQQCKHSTLGFMDNVIIPSVQESGDLASRALVTTTRKLMPFDTNKGVRRRGIRLTKWLISRESPLREKIWTLSKDRILSLMSNLDSLPQLNRIPIQHALNRLPVKVFAIQVYSALKESKESDKQKGLINFDSKGIPVLVLKSERDPIAKFVPKIYEGKNIKVIDITDESTTDLFREHLYHMVHPKQTSDIIDQFIQECEQNVLAKNKKELICSGIHSLDLTSNMADQSKQAEQKKFGTFLGVFTPSVLTILGLIMYLRFGWVVGNVGLGYTLLIVVLASSITFITGLSASAIATNMLVGVGGEYYMISRSLGLEPGGAIGIPLYFCRTLSVTFYCFGLAETLILFWPEAWGVVPWYAIQLIAAIIIVLVTILSGKSAELVLKSQIPIMILVGLSLLALFIGVYSGPLKAPSFEANYSTAPDGFWYVFAVFFPAVTGFTAGIGMSGDLKDPKKSIPIGTIGAVVTCLVIYLMIPFAIASTGILSTSELSAEGSGLDNWIKVAFLGSIFIMPAVIGAILSSAFGSILGGPRVLQALSTDGLAPKAFSKLSKSGQPTRATWMTGSIALVAVLLGELNTVAVLVSVLFLTLYVAVNLSAAIEVIVAEPHYRPRIKVPWFLSILGALGAIFVMFLISPIACVVAIGIEILIYTLLKRRSLEQNWGDVSSGIWLNIAKRALLNHSKSDMNPRNWRPQILLFTRDVNERIELVKLAAAISENKGILTLSKLMPVEANPSFDTIQKETSKMLSDLSEHGIEAFCEVNVVRDVRQGTRAIAKAHGIAGLKSNTIMEGLSETHDGRVNQLIKLKSIARDGKNILFTRFGEGFTKNEKTKKISIWWRGKENNADLMLLIAYLLKLNGDYKDYKIQIMSVVSSTEESHSLKRLIEKQLKSARITAEVNTFVAQDNIQELLVSKSIDSDIVLFGLPIPKKGGEEKIATWVNEVSMNLNITIFVYNAGMANAVPKLL